MNENIKTFSLVVITICVFILTVISILKMIDERKNYSASAIPSYQNQGSASLQNPPPAPIPGSATVPAGPKTSIKFEEGSFDFGDINQGDIVNHPFAFTNTGSNPLIISNAVGSCGCTVPTYPKEPIAPGDKGIIQVQFNSSGKKDLQDKTVTITANTEPSTETTISIHANVHAKE